MALGPRPIVSLPQGTKSFIESALDLFLFELQEEGKSVFRLDLVALKKMKELKTPDSKSRFIFVYMFAGCYMLWHHNM